MDANSFAGPRAFARYMLQGGRLTLDPLRGSLHSMGSVQAMESILFREGCWQAELVILLPHAQVPVHRHRRCDSCDVVIGGYGVAEIGEKISAGRELRGSLVANLVSIPKDVWHGGAAGEKGSIYLSFQKWDGRAALISEDWELKND